MMRLGAVFILSLGMIFGAGSSRAAGEKVPASHVPGSKAHGAVHAAAGAGPSTPSSLEAEINELREAVEMQRGLLRAQEKRIDALESELRAARGIAPVRDSDVAAPGAPAPAMTAAPPQASDDGRIADLRAELDAAKKSFGQRIKKIGPFSFSGDLKLRDEPVFGGPADNSQVHNRMRYRLRFNVTAKIADFSGGFTLASGDVGNPISTTQTANQFFTRKPFRLDRAFLAYNPHFFKPLTLTGGKFSQPWYSTELTWDKDLNPEGVAQTLAFDLESAPALKRVALVGFALPFTETARATADNKSLVQSAVYGGQLQTQWRLASWLQFSAYEAFFNWRNPDPVALATAAANPASPDLGLLRLNNNGNQNSTLTTTAITVATGQRSMINAQFASQFALLDTIARFDIGTRSDKWPVAVIGDFVQNTRACANLSNLSRAPANTATQTFSQSLNAPCDSHQRRGYWLESRVGRSREPGDWTFAYTRAFIEREAVIGAFDYSSLRQGTNVTQHRAELLYQFNRNIEFGFTGLFGRPLVTASSPARERFLKRLQFDVNYKF